MGGAILYGALDIRDSRELKDMVTSPGGTTIEGCEALEKPACVVL